MHNNFITFSVIYFDYSIMKEIKAEKITEIVGKLCQESNYSLGPDVVGRLENSLLKEESETGKEILKQILNNAEIADKEGIPMCQDTGFTVVFLEIGQQVSIIGGNIYDAVNEGVRQGYKNGYLRKSIVRDPLRRVNTGDNTPAVVHTKIVTGNNLKITVVPKGGGSENMSEVKMMAPAVGIQGVEDFVLDKVIRSGGNPCPPIIVGVGIGGTFELCAFLAKKSLMRIIGSRHPDPFYSDLEKKLLEKINLSGVGPMGLGGRITALEVFIEVFPCHIASLPVAVNIQCHAARHKEAVL